MRRHAQSLLRLGFKRLQTRFTVLYVAMFGIILVALAVGLNLVVAINVKREVGAQLESFGATFDRVWTLQADRLSQSGTVLASDFGFRQAVALGDKATTDSALSNLSERLGVDSAFLLKPDGAPSSGSVPTGLDPRKLAGRLDPYSASSGVIVVGGRPFMAVAAPVLAPDPQGWVVFTLALGAHELKALEKTASIPLHAEIVVGHAAHETPKLAEVLSAARQGRISKPAEIGQSLLLARPLTRLDDTQSAALTLSFPLEVAAAPYRRILDLVFLAGLGGAGLLVLGGWFVARSVTRPVGALDEAAQALGRGEDRPLIVSGQDELARLSRSFNTMATTIREREAHITALAHRDMETGLANRRHLEQQVAARLAAGARHVAVAEICIDRFAKVRAAIGHDLALELIGAVGARIEALGFDKVARMTSSTLAVAFACDGPQEALARLADLGDALRGSVEVAGADVDITTTIGCALSPEHGTSAETLLGRAAIALEQAAESPRRLVLFDAAAYGDPARNLSLMSELMEAIRLRQLTLAYQPKYDLRKGRVTGVEALTRWRHPVRGPLSPDLFVTMAEQTGHIREMTDWTLTQAMHDQAALKGSGLALDMSVNLSGRLLCDDDFMQAALAKVAGAPGRLCLEITETSVMDEPLIASRNMQRLVEAGIEVSIDDYGSGLSSLAYLRDIPATELKIDKAFVMKMDQDAKSALLVRSTITMAHALGLKVTAEGVETATVQALLAGMGCDLAQGYFIARPMPLADLSAFLSAPAMDAQGPKSRRGVARG
jgi:diguanylate cyclase (GGDEF)-like protein